jgi:Type II secretion system (T2SS), protein E, N-terminal domain
MSEATTPATTEEAEARALAERAGLEYREAGAVAVDPRALSILPAEECRRLRAVPLAATTGSAEIAVSDPSDERLEAVRQLTGASTRFVVLTDRTLDALLRSRMFAGSPPAEAAPAAPAEAPPEPTPEPVVDVEPPLAPEPVEPPREPDPPEPVAEGRAEEPVFSPPISAPSAQGVDGELVDAIVAALGPRLQSFAAHTGTPRPPGEHVGDSIMDPVARVDAAIEAWSSLRAALETIGQELDASRQSLREAKEQLSVLHAENDQQQVRIDALEAEVAERKTLVDEARLRLQDAAKALGAHGSPEELR